jgi:hypothetical protein
MQPKEKVERMLRQKLKPVAAQISTLFVDSMMLRINYRMAVAQVHGAEPEDMPKVAQQAIDDGAEIMRLALEDLSEVKQAVEWNKKHDKGNRDGGSDL